MPQAELRFKRVPAARIKGYQGDSCDEFGNVTLIRNGTCLKCDTCGATSGRQLAETTPAKPSHGRSPTA